MNQEFSQMTIANVPQLVKTVLISQISILALAALLEFSLFFTIIYESYIPYICKLKFTGEETCLDYNGETVEYDKLNCNDCSFLKLLWPLSLVELVILIFVCIAKIIYVRKFKWRAIIKILTFTSMCILLIIEIYLLTKYNTFHYEYSFSYQINLYPIIAKIIIAFFELLIIIAIWIEDAYSYKFKYQLNIQSSASSSFHQQLLSMQ